MVITISAFLSEIDYDTLYSKYISWLDVHNLQYECVVEHAYMKKNMEWVQAKCKTIAVIGFERYYKYITSIVYPDNKSEYQKDIWDVRKLGIPVNITPGSPKYTINFQKISQEWLREKVRTYIYHRVQYKAMNTVLKDINAMNIFSEFLKVYYPNINGLTLFNRTSAEEFIAYMRTTKRSSLSINMTISHINLFFVYLSENF